jgi:eukaryotic-like serine/threonine-protein kinase
MSERGGSGDQVGRVLDGRYRIEAELGAGGAGVVYRAEHLQLGRAVAVKLLHSEFGGSQNQVLRFEREARTLAALSHPHIVTVTDYGACDGVPYLVMELLEGRTLQDLLREEGALPPARAFGILRETLRALAYAHGQGLVHRDLKPGNIFLQALPDAPDHVRILDFGLAKVFAGDSAEQGPVLTRTGAVFGTPAYMAPEQASGDAVDASTDVYAAGVVLFEMLAGHRPFSGNMGELLKHHLLTPVPALHQVHPERVASPELGAFLNRAMGKRRGDRFPDAGAMLEALEALPMPAIVGPGSKPSQRRAAKEAATVPAGPTPAAAATEETKPSRPSHPAPTPPAFPSPPERPGRLASALGLGAVLLVSAGIGAAVWGWARTGDPGEAFHGAPELPSVDDLVARVKQAPPEGEWSRTEGPGDMASDERAADPPRAQTDTPNPWEGPVPPELASVRRALLAGRTPSKSVDDRLRRYARRHPKDPRPYLLLGGTYVARGWRSDAIDRYERAHRVDPAAKGDPRMLADLLSLVKHPAVSARAARAVREIYGADAIPVIEAKLATPGMGADEGERLRRLKASLR